MGKERNTIPDVLPTHESEGFSQVLVFDSVGVKLKSTSGQALQSYTDYFQPYAQVGKIQHPCDWTLVDHIDSSANTHSWTIDEDKKEIMVTRNSDDEKFTIRILRSLVMLEDMSHEKVMFKGASFVNKNGNGVVLLGERFAGKTSLLLSYMLKDDPSTFVTNSQVSLGVEKDTLYASGYPMSVGVRLRVLEAMQEAGNTYITPLVQTLKETMQPGEEDRYYLGPDDLKRYFQNRIVPKTSVKSIVIVKSIPPDVPSSIKKLQPEEVLAYVREYQEKNYNLKDSWYPLFEVHSNQQEQIEELLKHADIFELTYSIGSQMEALSFLDTL